MCLSDQCFKNVKALAQYRNAEEGTYFILIKAGKECPKVRWKYLNS